MKPTSRAILAKCAESIIFASPPPKELKAEKTGSRPGTRAGASNLSFHDANSRTLAWPPNTCACAPVKLEASAKRTFSACVPDDCGPPESMSLPVIFSYVVFFSSATSTRAHRKSGYGILRSPCGFALEKITSMLLLVNFLSMKPTSRAILAKCAESIIFASPPPKELKAEKTGSRPGTRAGASNLSFHDANSRTLAWPPNTCACAPVKLEASAKRTFSALVPELAGPPALTISWQMASYVMPLSFAKRTSPHMKSLYEILRAPFSFTLLKMRSTLVLVTCLVRSLQSRAHLANFALSIMPFSPPPKEQKALKMSCTPGWFVGASNCVLKSVAVWRVLALPPKICACAPVNELLSSAKRLDSACVPEEAGPPLEMMTLARKLNAIPFCSATSASASLN